jgi:hypothetical protein
MVSTDQSYKQHRPETLIAIQQAYDAVWGNLYANQAPTSEEAKELSIRLSQTLVDLACNGVTDPNVLRRQALEEMALKPR